MDSLYFVNDVNVRAGHAADRVVFRQGNNVQNITLHTCPVHISIASEIPYRAGKLVHAKPLLG